MKRKIVDFWGFGLARRSRASFCSLLATGLAAAALGASPCPAQQAAGGGLPAEGSAVVLRLDSGETLCGTLAAAGDAGVTIEHAILGRIKVPRGHLSAIAALVAADDGAADCAASAAVLSGADAVEAAPAAAASGAAQQAATAPPHEPESEPPTPPLWAGELEAGFNGSEGNSPQSKLRLAGRADRRNERREIALSASYSRASDDGSLSESRAIAQGRHDWLFEGSRWQLFVDGSGEFDEFKDYDARVTSAAGAGYRFFEREGTRLLGRLGVGVAREIGGSDDRFVPEGQAGLEFEHRLTQRQTIRSELTIFPEFDPFGEFRSVATAQWDLRIEDTHDVKLRLGVEDRYDSTPEGFKHNDFDYYASLVWGF